MFTNTGVKIIIGNKCPSASLWINMAYTKTHSVTMIVHTVSSYITIQGVTNRWWIISVYYCDYGYYGITATMATGW